MYKKHSVYILTIFFVIGAALKINAQWKLQNVHPDIGNISSVYFYDSLNGLCSGNKLAATTDGGKNWEIIKVYDNYLYPGVLQGQSKDCIWLTGFFRQPLKSSDKGKTWDTIPFPYSYYILSAAFINKDTILALGINFDGDGGIYFSSDGGNSWNRTNYMNRFGPPSYIKFISDNTGFITYGKNILKTTNRGLSWDSLYVDLPYRYYFTHKPFFVNDSVFYLCVRIVDSPNPDLSVKTTDGGKHWIDMRQPFKEISFITSNLGYACGDSGLASKTTDGGSTWNKLKTEVSTNLTTLNIFNQDRVIFFGNGDGVRSETVLATSDGGNSWQRYDSGSLLYFNVLKFLTPQIGWGGTNGGRILKTTDSGITWTLQREGLATERINACHFTDIQNGVMLSYNSSNGNTLILITTNSGATWENPLSMPFLFNSVFFNNNKTGFICGDGGRIYKTTNGGKIWKQMATPGYPQSLNSICFSDDRHGWAAMDGTVLKTIDGGNNWFVSGSSWGRYFDIAFADSLNGWLAGVIDYSNVPLCRTTDGGREWRYVFFDQDIHFLKVNILSPAVGYAFTDRGELYKTADSGKTWSKLDLPFNSWASAISFFDNKTGWCATPAGQLFMTTTGGEPVLNSVCKELSNKYEFALSQNYPNPFNPTTTINYSLCNEGHAKLLIYNILGETVKIVFDEVKYRGDYKIEVNLSGLASGFYFYSLFYGDKRQTKKLLLLK